MLITAWIVRKYSSAKTEQKLRAVMTSMLLAVVIMVIQLLKPGMLITPVGVLMLILSIYMSIGDPKIYYDDAIMGFNRDGFKEILDYNFDMDKKFIVLSIEVTNWTELTDITYGLKAEQVLSFTSRLSEKLESPVYRSRHNCVSYIVQDTAVMRAVCSQAEHVAESEIAGVLESEYKKMRPLIKQSVVICPDDADSTEKVLENIYSMLLEAYRGAIYYDEATGCYNRNAYENDLSEMNAKMRSSKTTVCVMADVNGLKHINDTYGHKEGDMAIRETATLIKKYLQPLGIVYRIGGDEFLTVIFNSEPIEVERNVQEMRRESMSKKLSCGEPVSFSVGIAYGSENDSRIEGIITYADKAMYEDKKISGMMR